MSPQLTAREAAAAIVRIAERQHGAISLVQLREQGLSWEQVRERVRAGWLRRIHRGVFVIAGRPLTRRTRWLAAVLACGESAVLSHLDAGMLWRIVEPPRNAASRPVEVTIEGVARRRHPGIRDHRCRPLQPLDRASHEGIPVTAPAKTILDLAANLPRRRLERAVDEAEHLKLCTITDLGAALRRHRPRRGSGAVARLLARHRVGSTRTRSELEERFLALCRRRGFPAPLVNAPLLGLTVDFLWPDRRVVVEVDGRASHDTGRGFQDDRDRDSLLTSAGFRTLRFTWWDLTRRPAVVADRLRRVLALP